MNLSSQSFLKQNFFALRSVFYLLEPSETYYEKVDDVPDITGKVKSVFLFQVRSIFYLFVFSKVKSKYVS